MNDLVIKAVFALTASERKHLEEQGFDLEEFECLLVCPWERVKSAVGIMANTMYADFRGEEVAITVVR